MTGRRSARFFELAGSGVARAGAALRAAYYEVTGRRPWRLGYGDYKLASVRRALADAALAERFRSGAPLPAGYGIRLDERVVEYPWVFARLADGAGLVLDAGSALNHGPLIEAVLVRCQALHIATLAPEPECHWRRGVSYVFADLRNLPAREDLYDTIVCISTLEHVGLDNSQYTGVAGVALRPEPEAAVRELRRVLKPGGRLLASVPYGRRESLGWQQVFDHDGVSALLEAFGPSESRVDVYRYRAAGWETSDLSAAADAEYFDVRRSRVAPDGAAAARAVACLELRKKP